MQTLDKAPRHAPIPLICPKCHHAFLDRIAERPTEAICNAVAWCPHDGALAICQVQGGFVRSWMIEGPQSAAKATATLHQLAGLLLVEGARPDGTLQ